MQQYATTRSSQDATCLIVEDSQFDQEMMTRVIGRSEGKMQVRVAATLQSAREALAAGKISLILLDNNMPDGLGAEFALELSLDPKLSRIPVIMVSDWPTPFMWEKAASAGVLFVVNKAEFGVRYVEQAMRNESRKRARLS
ncbi:response regulator [Sulfitobacter guttiformis]|uniref:Response regulator receiver domain-containing protein n=1 Tax=Sulfitobacter guttiformis TaxID=74349 RepID=A0A420DSG3_9RHOB|nr:response regulator [Sulfitobacter guttiformis]KIN74689.1 putative response regulator recevier domain protein [Sulfitobacter guttiformis KCTC 32187]RKE97264.1 response regulator receiver domain-containing protein [Sulfitobacter guttiformis]